MKKTRLKEAVKKSGPTLLAVNLGVSVPTLYNWISGRSRPDPRSAKRLEEMGLSL